jgi:hypothetical protein
VSRFILSGEVDEAIRPFAVDRFAAPAREKA